MPKKKRNLPTKSLLFYKAEREHNKRKPLNKLRDESKTSKIVYSNWNKNWSKYPNKSDIQGIDTKKVKAKNSKQVFNWIKSVEPNLINTNLKGKQTFINLKGKNKHMNKTTLQQIANIRYRNVLIKKRKKKGSNDLHITLKR